MLSETISMRTLRSIDSPWRRLPWTLPAALLIWAAALWGVEYFMERPTHPPVKPPPIDARLIDLPAPVATATLGPGPPTAVEQPKPPPVVPRQVPVKPQVSPRTVQKPVAQKAKVITSAVDEPGNALTALREEAPAAENTASNGGARAGGGNNGSGGGALEGEFGSSDGPRFLSKTTPVYPPVAKRLQKEGNVLLRVTIDERGRAVDVEIVKGAGFGFDEEAVKAVRCSTFVPAKKEGKPLACKVLLPIRFVLKQS
jgi:periplasmic protein TonB